jgi:HK97 gp10 family phage protein
MAGGFMTMRVIGDDALVAKLEAAMVVTEAMQPTALQQSGYLVERRAKQIVTEKDIIDTGNLFGNIHTDNLTATSIEIISDPTGEDGQGYAVFNEYGTSKMAARPYMRPALDESKPEIEKLIGTMFMAEVGAVLGIG